VSSPAACKVNDKETVTQRRVFCLRRGWVLYKRGDYDDALSVLQKTVDQSPQAPEFRYHLAMAQLKSGARDSGRSSLEQALKSNVAFSEATRPKRPWRACTADEAGNSPWGETRSMSAKRLEYLCARPSYGALQTARKSMYFIVLDAYDSRVHGLQMQRIGKYCANLCEIRHVYGILASILKLTHCQSE
jgi:tetratricopeptide (TPR) repeat protein